MDDRFSPYIIFLCGEEEADKVGTGFHGQACRGQGRVEEMLAHEELEISEEES